MERLNKPVVTNHIVIKKMANLVIIILKQILEANLDILFQHQKVLYNLEEVVVIMLVVPEVM